MCFSLKRKRRTYLLCSVLVILFSQPSRAAKNPNQVILAYDGDNVTFNCDGLPVNKNFNESEENAVRWEMKRTAKKEDFQTFFVKGRYFEAKINCTRCKVSTSTYNNETGSVDTNFTIVNVDESHAGRFRCSIVWDRKGTSREYDLVVLASAPNCRLNESSDTSQQLIHVIEYDEVTVVCDVQYAGNWRPVFDCQPGLVQSFSSRSSYIPSNSLVEYVGTMNVTSSFNLRSITCNMNFTRTTSSSANSSFPDHPKFEWALPVMDVTYGFKGGNVTRDDTILNCRVDSNPEPTIQWVYYISDNSVITDWENSSSDSSSPIAISNGSAINVCNIYIYNTSKFTQSNEAESYNISFECTAEINERIVVGKMEFYLDKFQTMFESICTRTHEPNENIKGVTTTGENEVAGKGGVSAKQIAADLQSTGGLSVSSPQDITLSLQTILAIVLPLAGILLISFIVITVLICLVKSRRRFSTTKKKEESSEKKSESFGEQIGGANEEKNDIPEETAAAGCEQQIGDANDDYDHLYDEIGAVYDSIEPSPSESTNSSYQTVNKSGQPGTTRPYLSVIDDNELVEYTSSKTNYEDGHPTGAHPHGQTNPYNKPDANTTDYPIHAASIGYTTLNSSSKPNETALIVEVTPCEVDNAPTHAVVNKRGYQKLEPSPRQPDKPIDIKKEYVPLWSSPTPEEVEDLTPRDAQPKSDNTKGCYKLDSATATATAADEPPSPTMDSPPSSTTRHAAETDSAQIYNQTEQSQGYHKLDPTTLAESLGAAETYVLLDTSASRAERDNEQTSSDLNVTNNGYCTLGATAVKDMTRSTSKDYVPLLPSSQSVSTSLIDDQSNNYRMGSNNGYLKLDPHSLQSMSDTHTQMKDYIPLISSKMTLDPQNIQQL